MSEKLYKQSKVEINGTWYDLKNIADIKITDEYMYARVTHSRFAIDIEFDETFTKERALEILDIWRCL